IALKSDQCAIGFSDLSLFFVAQFPLTKSCLHKFTIPDTAHEEIFGQGIYRLRANSIQSNAELKYVIIVLRPGIYLGYAIDDFSQWNSSAEVANSDCLVLDLYLDFFAMAHDEFVYG